MKITRKTLFFSFLTFCLVIAFLESFLTVASVVSPRLNKLLSLSIISHTIPDERLGHRPNPELPGHDSKGFRNISVPNEAKIVAFGDSQTYGTGVDSQNAWPRQLEQLSGYTVYSMAYGGYGPVHSLILWEEASIFKPEIYIEAFYSGNDLFDSFDIVYNRGQMPYLKTSNKDAKLNIRKKEKVESIAQHVSRMYGMGKDKTETSRWSVSFIKKFLSSHLRLYGLARQVKRELFETIQAVDRCYAIKFAEINSDYCQVFENEQFRTIFTSEYRLSALDLEDSRIAEGFRISLEAINRMSKLAEQQKKQFVIVLIPTKELVFKELVQDPTPNYRALIRNEEQLWKITREFLVMHDIDFVDARPSLQDQLNRGIQPYKKNHDGHPNKYGHQAIAKLLYTKIIEKQRAAQMAEQAR
jgi:lysophospholipase L1-like esterase